MSSTAETLEERGKRYGNYLHQTEISRDIKDAMKLDLAKLEPDQLDALEMIAVKISRILNGDPDYIENWRDICGYSQLIVDRLGQTDGATDVKIIELSIKDGKPVQDEVE